MITVVKKLNKDTPDLQALTEAAYILKNGGLVAFPTETVYGLGANALDEKAVSGIFTAKGRPGDNPLIVHILEFSDLKSLVKSIPPMAETLAQAFWPGPLTMIFNKEEIIPYRTSGNLETVAIRMPAHPIARLLIQYTGLPIAAPSANRSTKPSPTRASHVLEDFNGRIDMLLDGGSCDFGLESTVLDLTTEIPTILRPGSVTFEMLSALTPVRMGAEGGPHKSPGQKYKHYAPTAQTTLIVGSVSDIVSTLGRLVTSQNVAEYPNSTCNPMQTEEKIGILATDETINIYKDRFGQASSDVVTSKCFTPSTHAVALKCFDRSEDFDSSISFESSTHFPSKLFILSMGGRSKPEEIAERLFDCLRKMDEEGITRLYVEGIDEKGLGTAIMNRLKRAAGMNILEAKSCL